MIRKTVKSSQIHSIGYDAGQRRLEIEFHGGSIYEYDNVPEELHAGFSTCESVGAYFGKEIKCKADKYPYRKLHPKPKEQA